ncbi:sensor histidine kinase [Spirillospora sp. NPDC048911]|uniref:sensor histidine kinase n=1 Tax=Spirillospora sp. NPDC048911 TaxID=3364527 RepID=UPI00371506C5
MPIIPRTDSRSAPVRTGLEAVRRRRFLIGSWPWRSAAFLLSGGPMALVTLPLVLLALPWLIALSGGGLVRTTILVGAGTVLLAGVGPLVAMPVASWERRRLRLVDARPIRSGHRRPATPGTRAWLWTRYTEPATWRELGYALLLATVAPVLACVLALTLLVLTMFLLSPLLVLGSDRPLALGMGKAATFGEALPYAAAAVVVIAVLPYGLALLAGAYAAVARALLQGDSSERLRAELVEVSRSRARLVDAFEAERRRIERDLHDGAQQSLLGLTLQIGLARLDLPQGSAAAENLDAAHRQAKQLMVELRELIHGIHPRVLTDRGLPAALGELADQSPLPVTVEADLPGRFPAHVEATAYFVVAEALTNAAKHSEATRAGVSARQADGLLVIEIQDDGKGGADPAGGTGLTGLADRVAVIDGRMLVSSPPGGPTLLRVELPCSLP